MKLLLLAGTAEARVLAHRLAERPEYAVTASLAGATAAPRTLPVPTRVGGFGGAAGLAAWLRAEGIDALIDATHPFAQRMPWNAAQAAAEAGLPRLRVLRPGWGADPAHREFPNLGAAFDALPAGAHVLATVGRLKSGAIPWRRECRYWLRSIDPPGPLPDNVSPIVARPPFPVEEEAALMRRLRITHLITKDAGGDRAKLDAAGMLGIAVHMVARPPQPPGEVAEDPEAALAWLDTLAHAAK